MSSKKTTKTQTANTLPTWLTSPYQAAVSSAGQLAQQPAIGANTQQAINQAGTNATNIANIGNGALGTLSGMAGGNFGANAGALTGAASGQFLNSNPFAQNGQPTAVSGALSGMAQNGGLNLDYLGQSGLQGFANGSNMNDNLTAQNGLQTGVSGALNGFRQNGQLDTGYLDQSLLNKTASGDFLTADSNPYIRGVAQQGADSAQARINAQFGAAGRSNGSGLYAQLFGQGIADASNSVYAQNYANERQLQQSAQGTLLSGQQTAREAALARQYGADSNVFGAENQSAEAAAARRAQAMEAERQRTYGAQGTLLSAEQQAREAAMGRQYGAQGAMFGAENASSENAASRQAQAYEAERARQQAASSGLLGNQLQASSQIPGILSAILSGNAQALQAGQYQDEAPMLQAARQAGLLSTLSQPFGMSSGTATEKTSGLGNALNVYANLMGSFKSMAAGA